MVSLAPLRPSSYNNRAQALRLEGRPDEALEDLNKAIELSKGEGRAGSAALCQRGVIHRKVREFQISSWSNSRERGGSNLRTQILLIFLGDSFATKFYKKVISILH